MIDDGVERRNMSMKRTAADGTSIILLQSIAQLYPLPFFGVRTRYKLPLKFEFHPNGMRQVTNCLMVFNDSNVYKTG